MNSLIDRYKALLAKETYIDLKIVNQKQLKDKLAWMLMKDEILTQLTKVQSEIISKSLRMGRGRVSIYDFIKED